MGSTGMGSFYQPPQARGQKKKMPHAYAPAPPINARATEANEYIH